VAPPFGNILAVTGVVGSESSVDFDDKPSIDHCFYFFWNL
jgi:hypothetical protein